MMFIFQTRVKKAPEVEKPAVKPSQVAEQIRKGGIRNKTGEQLKQPITQERETSALVEKTREKDEQKGKTWVRRY